MRNQWMKRELRKGQCVDLSDSKRTPEGFYVINKRTFPKIRNKDFCNAETEAWIFSIGKHRRTGQVLAAESSVFYENPPKGFKCVWLR